jgi:hypothetical protein
MRSTNILIFLVALNASAVVLGAAGLSGELGYQPSIGGDDDIAEANQTAGDVSAERGAFDAFVGAVISAAESLITIFSVVTAGPQMLVNLGAPKFVIFPFSTLLYILVGIDVYQVLSGRDLT